MIKIFIDKKDSVASVVEKVIASPDAQIVVVVPKSSLLGERVENFQLLKREADATGKTVTIQSVDDEALLFASESGFHAIHSFFQQDQFQRSLSDIVPSTARTSEGDYAVRPKKVPIKATKSAPHKSKEDEPAKNEDLPLESVVKMSLKIPPEASAHVEETPLVEEEERENKKPRWAKFSGIRFRFPSVRRSWMLGAGLIAFSFGIVAWGLTTHFSRAEIILDFNEVPWQYEGVFTATVTLGKTNAENNLIPGELFTRKKNTVLFFEANGRKALSSVARGKILVWNAYSEAPQPLVERTRFRTPEGKIFRLVSGITVPGATRRGTAFIPSSIAADVIADEAGSEYNIGPIPKLTLPGFEGSPRYDGFYGEIKEPMTGGSKGESPFPTEEDIAAAKKKTGEILSAALLSNTTNEIPEEFKVLQEASRVEITRASVDTTLDNEGKFKVFGEANLTALGFKEAHLKEILENVITKDNVRGTFRSVTFTYTDIAPDFQKGELRLSLRAEGVVISEFDVERFSLEVLGKHLKELPALVNEFDGSVEAKFWPPFLVRRVPTNEKRVTIVVQ